MLALIGIADYLPQYLGLLGTFIPPLGGVIIGDYLARWPKTQMPIDELLPHFNWVNLGIYVVTCVLAWLAGEFAIGIPPVISVLTAGIRAILCARLSPRKVTQS